MMNYESAAGRGAQRRARFRLAALTAALAAIIMLASACGSSSSTTAQLPTLQSMTNKALVYAQCMRSHGIQNFPSPTVQDNAHAKGVGFSMPSGIDTSSPQFKSAAAACKRQSGFGVISPAMIAAAMSTGLKFAECMRSHGIPDYPDPVDKGSNIQIGPGPDGGIDTNSARFQAARKACIPLLPDGGP
jgi:hypothetical protein